MRDDYHLGYYLAALLNAVSDLIGEIRNHPESTLNCMGLALHTVRYAAAVLYG